MRERVFNDFSKKFKESNPSCGEDLFKITYAMDSLLSQFQSWKSIEPGSPNAKKGVDYISMAILLLRSIKIYQGNNELTELERNKLKELGVDECSEDEIKNMISGLVKSSLAHGIGFMDLEFGIRKFCVMCATIELFKSGMQAINRQTEASKETVSPTAPLLEGMNNEVQDSLLPRTRT
ncbi:hypothetical protein [Ehrlichia japonica]|nr:hypothetical protein [Ehrlichia japonica]